jgi:hypothetical protein
VPEIGALQKELGSAIAQMEVIKALLLEVFEWSSRNGMYTPEERSSMIMKVYLARVGFPVVDIALRHYLKQFDADSNQHLSLVYDTPVES